MILEFQHKNGVQHVTSAPYQASSNGLVERAVQIIKTMLKKVLMEQFQGSLQRKYCVDRNYAVLWTLYILIWQGRVQEQQQKQKVYHNKRAREQNFCVGDLNQIKSNHFYCHITTAQVPWWVKFLWACSRQCKKTPNNLHMDRQCKKLHWSIYSAPDSAKKQQQQFTYGQTVQKSNSNLHMDSTYLQTVQKTMCKIHIHILSTHSVL